MNKSFLFIAAFFAIISIALNAQNNLNIQSAINLTNNEPSFFDIRDDFNGFWETKNIQKNGYYIENGVEKKAYGWKQFKRWEWYWNNRVDPTTGQFPDKRASDYYTKRNTNVGTRNATGNWTNLGPSTTSGGYSGLGRLNCIGFRNGDANTYYVGAPSGGLWKTTDNGSNWAALTDDNSVLGVSSVIVIAGASTATDIVYIGTGDRDGGSMWSLGGDQYRDNNSIGVLKSTDGGASWSTTGLSFTTSQKEAVNKLLLDTDDNNTIYAATSDGFYKTTDAGANWTNLYAVEFVDIEFKPTDDQTIYGATKSGTIYLSTDGGTNWTLVSDLYSSGGRRIDLAVSDDEPTWVYAVVVNTSGGLFGVYKSTDSGSNYSLLYNSLNILGNNCTGSGSDGQGSYDLAIAADPNDANKVFIGGVNTWYSSNGGTTWISSNVWTSSSTYNSCGSPVVHADKHFLVYQSGTSTLFECNDGGLYNTSDNGNTWNHLSSGLEISQLYRLGVSQTTSNDIIAGLQDCGTKALRSGTWADVIGGDGMDCMIDYTDEDIQYGEYQYGGLKRTTDKWASSSSITSGLSSSRYWVMPIAIDPQTNTTIYAGTDEVNKSTDQGTTWSEISSFGGNTLKELAIAPSNSNYIYTTTQSILYRTTDGGSNWSNITGTLPTGSSYITYIAIKDDDPNTVWVSMGQYNSYGVYETTDGGTTWTNISTGIPSIPVMCVVQNTQNTSQTELYAGTDVGVYVRVGSGSWTLYSDGLPNVVVNELKIYYNSTTPSLSRIRAATSGRGVWESELYSPPNSPPVADFSADITVPEVGETITFSDFSTNVPTSWSWAITPSTFSYVGGTSSSSQNPQVQFSAEDNYTVQLTATNAYGSDSEIKTGYISASSLQTYCSASGGGTIYINSIGYGSISNSGTGAGGYSNYTNLSNSVTPNTSSNITITFGVLGNPYSNDLGIWIDWNRDGDFDDTDENVVCSLNISDFTKIYTISVPEDASLGNTTMRIRLKYFDEDCGSACGTTSYGEVEDYKITVEPATDTWLGISSEWNTNSNWSDNNVPTESYNVTIPTSPSGGNFPIIPVSTSVTINKLTLETNAEITVNGTLQINE
jgi:photosystem II stability/assembly factor-like uncharacterized protein